MVTPKTRSEKRKHAIVVHVRSNRGGRRFGSAIRCGAGTKSAACQCQIVRMPSLQTRSLSGGTSIDTEMLLTFKPLRPACRRVLPHFLAPINGEVEQPIAVIHRLKAANCGPLGLEDIGYLPQVANDVHHARLARNQEPPASSCNRVAFSCVSLLPNPQHVRLGLESARAIAREVGERLRAHLRNEAEPPASLRRQIGRLRDLDGRSPSMNRRLGGTPHKDDGRGDRLRPLGCGDAKADRSLLGLSVSVGVAAF